MQFCVLERQKCVNFWKICPSRGGVFDVQYSEGGFEKGGG